MRTIFTSAIIACMLTAVASCVTKRDVVPSQETICYDVKAEKVNSITTESSINVVYIQSTKTSVKVECPENLAEYIDVAVHEGVLSAGFKSGVSINGSCRVTITVSSPEINTVDASSSSMVEFRGAVKQSSPLDVEVSSSASFNAQTLTVSKLSVDASSSATAVIRNVNAVEMSLEASAAAGVVADSVLCGGVDIEASSAAQIVITGSAERGAYKASSAATIDAGSLCVVELIKATASSAGIVEFKAERVGSIREESAGSVNRKK